MPLLLRKTPRSKWYKNPHVPWLPEGELQADALGSLQTKDNKLSLWYIEDDNSNLDQVLTALATTFDGPSNIDIALIDSQIVLDNGFKIETTKGATKIEDANKYWHRNLIELTANKLMQLAQIIMKYACFKRIPEEKILSLVYQAIDAGTIDKAQLKETFQEYLSPF